MKMQTTVAHPPMIPARSFSSARKRVPAHSVDTKNAPPTSSRFIDRSAPGSCPMRGRTVTMYQTEMTSPGRLDATM
eukprot:CAMPEP_0206034750 /NCGR_PEP_ID=MMETSP1466-20131121/1586_1 /ASSEMBLY_ACC=CAM_ASM_001126 /TAXON_ID=44452 /ORGANISM="Pavlova gyrans, Strain CCMP608" /LENGTH=75 /DNA_ID=CAMNT_0053409071 /DNA_START=593 /DNA_END=820 /DNA_ORIENTATION=-